MNSAENIKQLLMQDIDSLIVQPELYAKDGSGFNLFRVPHNPETFRPPNGQSKLEYSEIYVVSAYRLLDKVFTDAVIRPSRIKNEYTAICEMIAAVIKPTELPCFRPTTVYLPIIVLHMRKKTRLLI